MSNDTHESKQNASHTTGEWTLGNAHQTAKNHAICAGGQVIARVTGLGYPPGSGWSAESEANTKLMKAAPKLLEACERAFDEIAAINRDQELIDLLDAALAEAKGLAV